MALIRIQESSKQADIFRTKVSFNQGPAYDVAVRDPFSEEEEERLEWYFEEHLKFPFTDQVKAQGAATSITEYGEKLFRQVFSSEPQLSAYKKTAHAGLNTIQIEIVGQPHFHALHWEMLKDPDFSQPLALHATIVRRNLSPQTVYMDLRPSPTINLLIVAARPQGKQDISYRTISRPLVESLRQDKLPVKIDILRPGTYKALEHHLRATTEQYGVGYYHVIHFDVHGAIRPYPDIRHLLHKRYGRDPLQPYEGEKAFLFLEGEKENSPDPLEATELAQLLVTHQVPIAILNACQSGKQLGESETSLASHLMQSGVQMVLAMGYSITVTAAVLLMTTLYQQLFEGHELAAAIRAARRELYNRKGRQVYFNQAIDLEDWLLPVVYQNRPQRLTPRPFTPEEEVLFRRKDAGRYTPTQATYGFVGRDLDILQIEKRLLAERNLLLMRGMGGAGKTTLLKHLRAWWQTTGFVQQTYYFGYDERAWTLQQLMTDIAQQLYGPRYYTDFQPLLPKAQQAMLAQDLRSTNHLLILDNLESITGAHLAIQHTLPKNEQDALRSFLTDLAKGHTLVLLGSRGGEDWLAKGTFDDNINDLGGLDDEAASTLADRILERNGAWQYRDDENLRKLIKLLDGFPLAMEVVLANLKHQTPRAVLEALQAGDVWLDIEESQRQGKDIFAQKTQSILRCIDYSHSNLSSDARQLLLCLAPFTSVIWSNMLERYTAHLKQKPVLADLPFDRWPEVLREAQNWGLLSPDPDISSFLRLQPTLTYFLRNRLKETEQQPIMQAIETAFRQHYDELGGDLYQLLESKDPQERHQGLSLVHLEYENLSTALNLALAAHISILNLYTALSSYLDATQDQQRGLALGQTVLSHLETYPAGMLEGPIGAEFISVLDGIGSRQYLLKQYIAAEASYQKALSLWLENKSYPADRIKWMSASIYHQLGMIAQAQRQWQQAEQHYQQALQIYVEFNDRHEQAGTYGQLGILAREQRQWAQAEGYYKQALQIYIEFNDRYKQASTYHNLGAVAQEQRQWQQAEGYYKQALQLKIGFNDRYSRARTYHNLGAVAQEQRQWQQAEGYYKQALQIYIEFNDHHEQAGTYNNLGVVVQKQRQWAQAQQYYQRALLLKIEFNDRHSQARTYHNLGAVAAEQRLWQQAEGYYQQALQIYVEFNDRHSQASIYDQLGNVASEQRQWQQAGEYLLKALHIFMEYKDNHSADMTLRNLARLWKASGDAAIPALVAPLVGVTPEKAEALLRDRGRQA